MALLLCGFAAFFTTQLIKTFSPLPMGHKSKIVLAFFISAGVAALLFRNHFSDLAAYALAGAGLAVVIHRGARYLSVAGDWCIRQIVNNRSRG